MGDVAFSPTEVGLASQVGGPVPCPHPTLVVFNFLIIFELGGPALCHTDYVVGPVQRSKLIESNFSLSWPSPAEFMRYHHHHCHF